MAIDTTTWDQLKVSGQSWRPGTAQQLATLADGSVLRFEIGAPLWQVEATLAPGYYQDMAAVRAWLARMERPGEFAVIYDKTADGPAKIAADADLSAVQIHTLDEDNRRLRMSGLPAGAVISPGDWLGWTYGSAPTRHALHQVEQGATADANGVTPLLAVEPHIRPGAQVEAPVTLRKPVCKATLTDVDYGQSTRLFTSGIRVAFSQVLR